MNKNLLLLILSQVFAFTAAPVTVFLSGSYKGRDLKMSQWTAPHLTASKWKPYVSQIALYDQQGIAEPMIVGTLSQPVKMRDDSLCFKKISCLSPAVIL